MARDILLSTEQIEALQSLRFAANHAVGVLGDEDEQLTWRLERIARDSEETLLIAMGYPPEWMERMDREDEGTPLKELLQYGVAETLRRAADLVTLEEVSQRSADEIGSLRGIGPRRLEEISDALTGADLEFAEEVG